MTQFKPCPFCGEIPEGFLVNDSDPYLWCLNQYCPIYDKEIHYEKWNNDRPTKYELKIPKGFTND